MSRSATYNDWMDKLLESYSKEEIALQKKKILNATKDNAERRQLVGILGKEAPQRIDTYQTLKYENRAEWLKLRRKYQQKKKTKL